MVNASSVATPFNGDEYIIEYNDTSYGDDFPVYKWAIYTLMVLSCLCGLVGNSVVIWLLSFCLKRNTFTTYILNLAIADLGTLLSLAVRVILYTASYSALLLWDSFLCFTYSTSLYFLTAISLERCLSVLFPIWYRCHRPRRSSAVVSFFLWIIPGLLSGTLLVFDNYLSMESHLNLRNTIFTANLLIFTPIMVASTLIMSIKICRSSQRRQPPRLYIIILVTLLFFVVFAVPLSAAHFVILNNDVFPELRNEYPFLFASFNSTINPIIYYFAGRSRKKGSEPLKVVLKRAFRDEVTGQGGT